VDAAVKERKEFSRHMVTNVICFFFFFSSHSVSSFKPLSLSLFFTFFFLHDDKKKVLCFVSVKNRNEGKWLYG